MVAFLRVLLVALSIVLSSLAIEGGPNRVESTSNLPPRKVIVGTSMEAFWVEYPGLPQRLNQLGAIVDRMAAESLKKYGRRLDLAVLPEVAVNGEAGEDAFGHSFPLEGPVKESILEEGSGAPMLHRSSHVFARRATAEAGFQCRSVV